MSRAKEANNIYEKERHNVKLTHSDFAFEEQFEYLQENDEFNQYLLNKAWDHYFKSQKNGTVVCDIAIVNKVFEQCLLQFNSKMDSVQVFHLITDFYNISSTQYFNKLVQSHRMRLINDLEIRLGGIKSTKIKKINNKIQFDFNTIFGQ